VKHLIRPLPLASAFVVLGAAVGLVIDDHVAWWVIAVGVIGPDMTFLAAIGAPAPQPGIMPARVVRPYNLLHHPAGPIAATAFSALLGDPTAIALSLTWASHILWDRGLGYGLRAPDGSIILKASRGDRQRTRIDDRALSTPLIVTPAERRR
jgi:hypothetical protein